MAQIIYGRISSQSFMVKVPSLVNKVLDEQPSSSRGLAFDARSAPRKPTGKRTATTDLDDL